MRTIKIIVAYDGSCFHGWQIQPGVPTIQGALAEVAQQITQEKIYLHGASRTDAGVHALGQVASFRTQSSLDPRQLQRAFNALLPPSIRVVGIEEAGPNFHPRWNAESKTYHYRIYRAEVRSPFLWKRALHYPWPLDEAAMMAAARLFEGEHDFSSFAASSGSTEHDRDRNPVRLIYRAEIVRRALFQNPEDFMSAAERMGISDGRGYELVLEIHGKSFLRYMVRKIVGTLLEAGRGKLRIGEIPQLFEAKDSRRSGPTAPPDGLYLVRVEYPEHWIMEFLKQSEGRELQTAKARVTRCRAAGEEEV